MKSGRAMSSTSIPSIDLEHLDRVVVVGTSCSGKTTLARRLARILGGMHIELDALHWGPNWVERETEEFRARTLEAVRHDRWATDGNYHRVRDLVWGRATTVIWLDYSFPLVFSRCLRRTFRRVFMREVLYSGNRETVKIAFFSRDSIILWVIRTHLRRRNTYQQLFREPAWSHIRFLTFRSPAETERFLRDVESRRRGGVISA